MADKTACLLAPRLLTIPTSRIVVSVLRLFFLKTATTFVLPACEVTYKRNASIPTRALTAVSPLLPPLWAI